MRLVIEDAAAEWRRAFGEYDERRAAAEAGVVRWIYTKKPLAGAHPHAELTSKPSRALNKPPAGDHCATGLDAAGRPLVQRDVYRTNSRVIERFWRYANELQVGVQYSFFTPPMPTEVTLRRWEGGKLQEEVKWWISPGPGLAGWSADAVEARIGTPNVSATTWQWAGEQVLSKRQEFTGPFVASMGGRLAGTGRWAYDHAGVLRETFRYDGQREQLVWERPTTGESDGDVYAAVVSALLASVPRVVRDGPPVYAVALSYHYPDAMLPPLVSVARVDRRGNPPVTATWPMCPVR